MLKKLIEDRERIIGEIEVHKGHLNSKETALKNKTLEIMKVIGKTELADRPQSVEHEIAQIKAIGSAWESPPRAFQDLLEDA